MRNLLTALFLFLSISLVFAQTHRVPDDFDSIQSAVNESDDGDTVLVAPGEYAENIDLSGHSIVLLGVHEAPEEVIIDGGENGSIVTIVDNGNDPTTVSGFTLRNGQAEGDGGGGLFCDGSNVVFEHLIIHDCSGNRGGGIYLNACNANLNDLVLHDNTGNTYGGGICILGRSNVDMTNSEIYENAAQSTHGGGIYNYSQEPTSFSGCAIYDNEAPRSGGGMYNAAEVTLEECTFSNNVCESNGGGIFTSNLSAISNCTFIGNSALNGGGICAGFDVEINHTLIYDNTAPSRGSGIFVGGDNYECTVNFSTICFNGTGELEEIVLNGGIQCIASNSIIRTEARNTILSTNPSRRTSLDVEYSNLTGSEDQVEVDEQYLTWGDGNINADPLFSDPENGDFAITWDHFPADDDSKSPCIDTGDPQAENDPDDTRADMGYRFYFQNHPDIVVEPEDDIDFGDVLLEDERQQSITIGNIGPGRLSGSISLAQQLEAFAITEENLNFDLNTDEETSFTLTFTPAEEREYNAEITIRSTDPDEGEIIISVTGNGSENRPRIEISDERVDFGEVGARHTASSIFRIWNVGFSLLEGTIQLEHDYFDRRQLYDDYSIEPGDSIAFHIDFEPDTLREYEGVMNITSNDPRAEVIEVPLTGTGIDGPPIVIGSIEDVEIEEDADWTLVCDLEEIFWDIQEPALRYRIEFINNLEFEIREGQFVYLRPVANFWIQNRSCEITAWDIGLDEVSDEFSITVSPVNDPPQAFSLFSPADSTVFQDEQIEFRWQEARQNQFETDDVEYSIVFEADNHEWQVDEIQEPQITLLTIEILQNLDVDLNAEIPVNWYVEARDNENTTISNESRIIVIDLNHTPESQIIPVRYEISSAYPNPFNSTVSVRVGLPVPEKVEMRVYDVTGKLVYKDASHQYPAGFHIRQWDAKYQQPGTYFIEISSQHETVIRQVLLVK